MSDWIKKVPAFNTEIFICPHCKGEAYYKHHKDGQCGYKFCPNCGKQINEAKKAYLAATETKGCD